MGRVSHCVTGGGLMRGLGASLGAATRAGVGDCDARGSLVRVAVTPAVEDNLEDDEDDEWWM